MSQAYQYSSTIPAATSSAAPTPGSLWERMRRPSAAVARETGRSRAGRPFGNLIVQLGLVTEDLNRRWYEANTGQVVTDIQERVFHPALKWMAATLDGRVAGQRCGVRSQVHAAVVVLGRGGLGQV